MLGRRGERCSDGQDARPTEVEEGMERQARCPSHRGEGERREPSLPFGPLCRDEEGRQ